MEKDYPEEFYRGVSSSDQITKEGFAMAAAFRFSDQPRKNDGLYDLSINWNDDVGALETLLTQKKPGKEDYQFKIGYFTLNTAYLNMIMKQFIDEKIFSYERCPILAQADNDYQENLYHGNLLLQNNVDSNIRKNIQHTLAVLAGRVNFRSNT